LNVEMLVLIVCMLGISVQTETLKTPLQMGHHHHHNIKQCPTEKYSSIVMPFIVSGP